jgi:hypothetical protein
LFLVPTPVLQRLQAEKQIGANAEPYADEYPKSRQLMCVVGVTSLHQIQDSFDHRDSFQADLWIFAEIVIAASCHQGQALACISHHHS